MAIHLVAQRVMLAASLSLLAACGGSQPVEVAPSASVVEDKPGSRASAEVAAPAKVALPSPVFRAFRKGAIGGGYLDVRVLRDTEWFKKVLDLATNGPLKDKTARFFARCGNPAALVDEVAFSLGKDRGAVAFKLDVPAEKIIECGSTFMRAPVRKDEGDRITLSWDGDAFVFQGNVMYTGSPDGIRAMLEHDEDVDLELAKAVGPQPGRVLAIKGESPGDTEVPFNRLDVSLTSTTDAISFLAVIGAGDPDALVRVEKELKKASAELDPKGVLSPNLAISRTDGVLTVSFKVHGGVQAQLKLVDTLADLAAQGVQRYLIASKTSEAKNTVEAMARALTWASEREDMNHKFPPSSTIVPKTVPKGVKAQSSPDDWSVGSWRAIRFSIIEPTYYRYHFVTSPDGKSCDAIAEGDLNGDGKTSRFSMHLTINKEGAVEKGPLKIENELE